ncbi:MAG: hypothetical protein AAFR23_05965 [Pseudomonadota bacterium]
MALGLLYVSLAVNIFVLVPVCFGLLSGAPWVDDAYGARTAARDILTAVYLAILVASVAGLLRPMAAFVVVLLAIQVIYKLATAWTVGDVQHPVVTANVAIAALHIATLATVWWKG